MDRWDRGKEQESKKLINKGKEKTDMGGVGVRCRVIYCCEYTEHERSTAPLDAHFR